MSTELSIVIDKIISNLDRQIQLSYELWALEDELKVLSKQQEKLINKMKLYGQKKSLH